MRGVGLCGLLVLVGCPTSGGENDESEAASEAELPSPYADSGDESEGDVPVMAMDQAVASSVAGLQLFVSLQPDAVLDAYAALAEFEDGCPAEQESYEDADGLTTTWYAEPACTTSAGVEFSGGARLSVVSVAGDDTTEEAMTLSTEGGTLRITHADGRRLEMTGYVATYREVGPEATQAGFELVGQFAADPQTAADSPLLEGRVRAQGYAYSYSDGTTRAIGGAGSLSGEGLGEARAFSFADFLLLPTGCSTEPLGTMSVRDDAGYWHDIVFDAGTYDPESGDEPVFDRTTCDGCGTYLAGGAVGGQACVTSADIDSVLDWEDAPW